MSVIRFDSVTKTFNGTPVLRQFSMDIDKASMRVLLGGSGTGKSTILKIVLGLIKPDRGQVYVLGRDITRLEEDELMPIREKIGVVFQAGALFDSLSVGENVAYRLREQGELSEGEIEETVESFLGFVGLQDTVDKLPADLSGGMRRRVAIARALVGHPEVMLYDEPTAGLDPITSRTIIELVMRLRDLREVTSIFVTNDLHAVHTLASERTVAEADGEVRFERLTAGDDNRTRIMMLERGSVLMEGTEREFHDSANPYIREFLD